MRNGCVFVRAPNQTNALGRNTRSTGRFVDGVYATAIEPASNGCLVFTTLELIKWSVLHQTTGSPLPDSARLLCGQK